MLVGAVLGVGTTLGLREEPQSASSSETDRSSTGGLGVPRETQAQFDRIERAVSALLERGEGGGEALQREEVPGAAAPAQSLKELVGKIDTLIEVMRNTSPEIHPDSLSPADSGYVPTNTSAVTAVFEQLVGDRTATDARHFCWTARRLYETYGLPNSMSTDGEDEVWMYLVPNVGLVRFYLRGGSVRRTDFFSR